MSSKNENKCRKGCAACCIVISITSPLPGMPDGKPAGIRCVNLNADNICMIHEEKNYPAVCKAFKFDPDYCGETNEEAFAKLGELEILTKK
jgi:Fe-S-cluster containining protein